jgi:DNA-binding transcriptional regulator YdaS (Cro superfamily)
MDALMPDTRRLDPGLARAIEAMGSAKAIADLCRISKSAVSQWEVIPTKRCHLISEATGIPLHVLRPDVWEPPRNK